VNVLEAALGYAASRIPVFPVHTPNRAGGCSCGKRNCQSIGKHPRTEHGLKDATTDTDKIKAWWRLWPDANIGIPTGRASGILVLDIDPEHGGNESLGDLQLRYGPLPDTSKVTTGSGGSHILFKHPPDVEIKNSTRLAGYKGIDVRGDGGYVVAAPSLHASGQRYHRDPSSPRELAPPPLWLVQLATNGNGQSSRQAGHVDIAKILRGVPEGERNDTLFKLACSLRGASVPEEAATESVLRVAANCVPPLPQDEAREIVSNVYTRYPAGPAAQDEWSEPLPLDNELPPVEAFDENLLPESFRPAARDIAERMQVPIDFPAVSLVCCLAGVVNRRALIQPKAHDTSWIVVPNLWGGLIAPPGFMKSPTIATATRPLHRLEEELLRKYESECRAYEKAKDDWEVEKAAHREMVKANYKKGKEPPGQLRNPPDEPRQLRLIVNDCTFESAHQILRDNPAGLVLVRDELSGWWSQLDRLGREGERAFFLQAWNGDTSHTIDRIGRGSIHVPACCISMLGGIQPAKLRSYLADTLRGGPSDDGLIQRFQLLVWPDLPKGWEHVDRPPDSKALAIVSDVLWRLIEIPCDPPVQAKFSAGAQELFDEWIAELEKKVRSEELHPALAGHLSKFRKLMPALALVFELADRVASQASDAGTDSINDGPQGILAVNLEHTKQAASWCEFLESHARRIYSCVVTPQIRAAHVLADKIKARKLGQQGVFSLREVYLKGWVGLNSPELALAAAEILHDAGWIRPVREEIRPQGGRPSTKYEVNPKVLK
jgi:hypothetical protein